jgi:hypothetical protein
MSSSSSSSSSKSLTEVISAVIHRVKLSLAELADRNGSTAHAIKKHCNIDDVEGPFIAAALKAGTEKGIFVRAGRRWKIAPPKDPEVEQVGHISLDDRLKAGAANAIVIEDEDEPEEDRTVFCWWAWLVVLIVTITIQSIAISSIDIN